MANGQDTGTGFTVREIEENPSAFFGDSHTAEYTAGAVRGQLRAVPMGGVETGAGGTEAGATTAATDVAPAALGTGALVAAAAAGVVAHRRRGSRS
jgi:hypothetical protein